MTRRQLELLHYIGVHIECTGYSPSFDEMKEALGFKAKSNIHRLVGALEAQGKIRRTPGRKRSIEIVPARPLVGIPSAELRAELARRGEAVL